MTLEQGCSRMQRIKTDFFSLLGALMTLEQGCSRMQRVDTDFLRFMLVCIM